MFIKQRTINIVFEALELKLLNSPGKRVLYGLICKLVSRLTIDHALYFNWGIIK